MTPAERLAEIVAKLPAEDGAFLRAMMAPRWQRRAARLAERDAAVLDALKVHVALRARPAAEALAGELLRAAACPHAQGERAALLRRILDLSDTVLRWRQIMNISTPELVQRKNQTLHKPPVTTAA